MGVWAGINCLRLFRATTHRSHNEIWFLQSSLTTILLRLNGMLNFFTQSIDSLLQTSCFLLQHHASVLPWIGQEHFFVWKINIVQWHSLQHLLRAKRCFKCYNHHKNQLHCTREWNASMVNNGNSYTISGCTD